MASPVLSFQEKNQYLKGRNLFYIFSFDDNAPVCACTDKNAVLYLSTWIEKCFETIVVLLLTTARQQTAT